MECLGPNEDMLQLGSYLEVQSVDGGTSKIGALTLFQEAADLLQLLQQG